MRPRLASAAIAIGLLVASVGTVIVRSTPTSAPEGSNASGVSDQKAPKDPCKPKKNCPLPSPSPSITPSPTPSETPMPSTSGLIGFGARKITPVGNTPSWPPTEWKDYFTPHPETAVWGEPYIDVNANKCYDNPHFTDVPEPDDPHVAGQPEPHVDQPWNETGNAYDQGAFTVNGVTIYGDPQSAGKWDGVWANAGFGAKCTLGMHDDTWARAVVAEVGDKTVAMVSLDVVGFFNIDVRRATKELAIRYPDMPIDELAVSSTHTHEGVDTMGYWGQALGIDGKFPAYNAFIRSQLIDAVHEAYVNREPSVAKFAETELTLGIRDSRPPQRIDPYLLAAEFIRPSDGTTIGTIVNWSNHPEAQASNNQLVSSDFPHGARETLENDLGGTSIYFSGSVGGLMTPLGKDIPGFGSNASWERTFEIGRIVASTAEQSLATAPIVGLNDLSHERREFYIQADNTALSGLNAAGVFDIPTYVGADSWGKGDHVEGTYAGRTGEQFKTEMVAIGLGPAMFLTVPGELFPEIELGGYGRSDCAAADTGRPYEPVIVDQFSHEYKFVLGLGQDELGYIVPGYDFWLKHADDVTAEGQNDHQHEGVIALGALEEDDPCGEGHYEETVSGSSVMAPWVACVAAELGGKDPWALSATDIAYAACTRENTHLRPFGVNPDAISAPSNLALDRSRFEHPAGYYDVHGAIGHDH